MNEPEKPLPAEWFFDRLGRGAQITPASQALFQWEMAHRLAEADHELSAAVQAGRAAVSWHADAAHRCLDGNPAHTAVLEIDGVASAVVRRIICVDEYTRKLYEAELAYLCIEELRAVNKGGCA